MAGSPAAGWGCSALPWITVSTSGPTWLAGRARSKGRKGGCVVQCSSIVVVKIFKGFF